MDLITIGNFISSLRKEKGLTQEELGERVGVTNKTVSRWETGTYLPPADVLVIMSEIFEVSINEILSGKRLSDEEYRKAAEENLCSTIKESSFSLKDRIEYFKKKWLKEHIAIMIIAGLCIIGVLLAGIFIKNAFVSYLSVVLLIVFHCIRYNSMMAYVERNAFGKEK